MSLPLESIQNTHHVEEMDQLTSKPYSEHLRFRENFLRRATYENNSNNVIACSSTFFSLTNFVEPFVNFNMPCASLIAKFSENKSKVLSTFHYIRHLAVLNELRLGEKSSTKYQRRRRGGRAKELQRAEGKSRGRFFSVGAWTRWTSTNFRVSRFSARFVFLGASLRRVSQRDR